LTAPVAVTVFAHARAEKTSELKEMLADFAGRARAEEGCLEYHVHQDRAEPGLFVFYEVWRSDADMNTHLAQPYMTAFMEHRMRYLDREVDVHVLSMHTRHPLMAE
jgi:quinol monooxygenase YgiN